MRDISGDNSWQNKPAYDLAVASLNFPKDLPADFSRQDFVYCLRRTWSLGLMDKLRILLEIPTLSINQLEDLDEFLSSDDNHSKYQNSSSFQAKTPEVEKEWIEVVRRWHHLTVTPPRATFDAHQLLTPEALHILLNAHVIGQDHVTKELATLAYRQMMAYHHAVEATIPPPRIVRPLLLAGFTGTGKTFVVQKVSELAGLPFVHVNTASLVSEGIVGTSLNDIGKKILLKADNDVRRAEFSIVFLDEFDKTLSGYYGNNVVNQLLRLIEGDEFTLHADRWDSSETRPKQVTLNTSSMLFIFGGAFQLMLESTKGQLGFGVAPARKRLKITGDDLVEAGFPKELAGRISTILTLNPLTEDDYYDILTTGESSPLKDYLDLIRSFGDDIHVPEEALREIARQAVASGLGARGLDKIIHEVFKDILYEAPNPIIQSFVITREKVLSVVAGDLP